MELRLHHIIHLYNVFRENDGRENCAQLIDEEFYKMFDKKSLNDEHDCNIVSMKYLNVQNANDDCTSHDNDVSYKNVNFRGVNWECDSTTKREDRFCRSINI